MATDTATAPFHRELYLGKLSDRRKAYIDIDWDGDRLSITGHTVRPYCKPDNWDSAGQIQDELKPHFPKLRRIWNEYHLNDMQAACEHQRALGWTWSDHPSAECPTCGYKLGSAWLHKDVPADVLEYLRSFDPNA